MEVIAVIPARYASSRLPGKPLASIRGRSLLERVYRRAQAAQTLSQLVVATDDERIATHVQAFGGEVVLTSPDCPSGTDRLAEAARHLGSPDVWLNIQGDEPFIIPQQIDLLVSAFDAANPPDIATLIKRIGNEAEYLSPSEAKVVCDGSGHALYFSRAPIPHLTTWNSNLALYKHIGLYAFSQAALNRIAALPPSPLEQLEQLEQLRWLENGLRIRCVETDHESRCVDTPEDLAALESGFDALFADDARYFPD
jgi:3-deoxy-manno-octulosonate cytidylyltransferase (CMP-KDO synthetase)